MREGVPVCDETRAIPHSRARDGRVWRAADAVDAVAEQYALAVGDDPACVAALLRSLCAEPAPRTVDLSTPGGWSCLARMPARRDPRGFALTVTTTNRAQIRAARRSAR